MARKSKTERLQELWEEWKKTKDERLLDEMLDVYNLDFHLNKFKGGNVPRPVLETAAYAILMEALPQYNPKKDATVKTFLDVHMQRLRRVTNELQRIGRIPENRALKISQFNSVLSELRAVLGREPSNRELADKLGWSEVEVQRMKKDLRLESPTGALEQLGPDNSSLLDAVGEANRLGTRVIDAFYYSLSGIDQKVFEGLVGYNSPKKSVQQIAEELGITPAQVYNIRRRLLEQLQDWIYSLS